MPARLNQTCLHSYPRGVVVPHTYKFRSSNFQILYSRFGSNTHPTLIYGTFAGDVEEARSIAFRVGTLQYLDRRWRPAATLQLLKSRSAAREKSREPPPPKRAQQGSSASTLPHFHNPASCTPDPNKQRRGCHDQGESTLPTTLIGNMIIICRVSSSFYGTATTPRVKATAPHSAASFAEGTASGDRSFGIDKRGFKYIWLRRSTLWLAALPGGRRHPTSPPRPRKSMRLGM